LNSDYDHQKVKSFIAPHWTFEFCLYRSTSLGALFKSIILFSHPKIDSTNFETGLAKKLLKSNSLNKTDVAYKIALEIEEDLHKPETEKQIDISTEDESISYLIEAIKYACNN
jgi:putative ATP-dependent endonuclease of OLD family